MLHIHRSERADQLVEILAGVLAEPPADPFARDLISVPTRGMERWLTQQLAARLGTSAGGADGVAAALDFPLPGRLLADVLATASGIDPDADPWRAQRLVWPLLEVTEDLADAEWLAPLTRHLAGQGARRYALLAHLAELYERYGQDRPAMIVDWAQGSGGHWQAELWRALAENVGVPSPAQRLEPACARLIAQPDLVELGARPVFFGLTRLAASHVRLLSALADGRDIHLMLLHPSPALWDAVARAGASTGPRRADTSVGAAENRLLASWGRDARELQIVLSQIGASAPTAPVQAAAGPQTLLTALQRDIRADVQPPGAPLDSSPDQRLALDPDDESIRIHACHGRRRQVEVLREAILHRLAADPTLEPRDVIVMCPDIEEFAPLIEATFADGVLPVRLADRTLRQTNPLLAVAARLLELAGARLTASEVMDLIDTPVVRRRFAFSDDDIGRIRGWIVEAEVHWGLDHAHRGRWHLPDIDSGTWARGIRRLLLSVAIQAGGSDLYGGALPAGEVDSSDIELVGSLAELIDRLDAGVTSLLGPLTVRGWADALAEAVDSLAEPEATETWQRAELGTVLDAVASDAGFGAGIELSAAEARHLLADRLAGRPTRANFRTGHLTVCTLHPMRSIPHRVVCLLGLDDHAFPRRAPRDGDDLLADAPWIGDRDRRAEDRQLLLDAVMAAGDALIVTYSGNDERTNAELPPAVPIGELLDAADATAVSARSSVLVRHPLQTFDPRNFDAARPWSFDPVALTGAQTLAAGPQQAEPAFLGAPLDPAEDEQQVALGDLIAFVERPARAFLRQRLGVSVARWDDEVSDELAVEMDGLERWGVGQRLLEAVLAGADWEQAKRAEIARGALPPDELGYPILDDIARTAAKLAAIARSFGDADPRTFETNLVLPDGVRLTGIVSGVRDRILLSVAYSSLNPRHRLAAWVRLLALSAAHPDVPWEAISIGRGSRGAVAVSRLSTLGGDPAARRQTAVAELETLLALRRENLTRPLAVPSRTAEAYVAAVADGRDPLAAARGEWASGWTKFGFRDREDAEAEHLLVFGRDLPAAALAQDAPRIWGPLRARERMETL